MGRDFNDGSCYFTCDLVGVHEMKGYRMTGVYDNLTTKIFLFENLKTLPNTTQREFATRCLNNAVQHILQDSDVSDTITCKAMLILVRLQISIGFDSLMRSPKGVNEIDFGRLVSNLPLHLLREDDSSD